MNRSYASDRSDCEQEWLDRPISAIAAHISSVYHAFTRDRLPLLAHLSSRLNPTPGWGDMLPSFNALVSELRDAVETHGLTEDDRLFPVLVALEYPHVLSTSVTRDELARLLETLSHEHLEIRRLILDLEALTDGFRAPAGAPTEFDDTVRLLHELTRSLIEELDLEDRCLLPRARRLTGQTR